jgi:hypothetical protein
MNILYSLTPLVKGGVETLMECEWTSL